MKETITDFHTGLLPQGFLGCYAIFDDFGECLYVGQTRSLSGRMRKHRNDFRFVNADMIFCYDFSKEIKPLNLKSGSLFLNYQEAVYIRNLRPSLNQKRPQFSLDLFHTWPLDVQRVIVCGCGGSAEGIE